MKNIKNIPIIIIIVVLSLYINSCSNTSDDYLQFVKDGEISYTEKVSQFMVYSGRNRVKVEGAIVADPKVSEVRIYWNTKKDSVVVPINRTSGIDIFSKIIEGLDENIYNFVAKTFDAQGNSSVEVSMTAEVFGDYYINTLTNRPLINNEITGDTPLLTINFDAMDLSTGVIGTEVVYQSTDGTEKTVFVNINDPSVEISDYELTTTLSYRTAYLPVETAIDTFYSDYDSFIPNITPILKNASQPFQPVAEQTDGRFRTLAAPWITNDAAKSHYSDTYGYVGGYDNYNGSATDARTATMSLEAGYGGEPYFTNAKIYQTAWADAKTYKLLVDVYNTNYASGSNYIVVTIGDGGIPDVTAVTTAPEVLAYKSISARGVQTIEFTVPEISKVSIGIVSTQTTNRYCFIKSWKVTEN